ncbi:MAG: nucleotide exchange factor GrpE [Gemmatimonadales bacterium]|nr:nucleotide exchange factor GrpE [Gemmatimonadales bacterium]
MTERPFEENELPDPAVPETAAPEPGSGHGGLPQEPTDSAVRRLAEQLEDANDRYLRLAAEFDNFRKRVARERIELSDRAEGKMIGKVLEVMDDLDRLTDSDWNGPAAPYREGVDLIGQKFHKRLEAAGLETIDPTGAAFDPTVAEAVSTVPSPAADQDNTVSATFQVGYRYKGILIRPARVQVYLGEGTA